MPRRSALLVTVPLVLFLVGCSSGSEEPSAPDAGRAEYVSAMKDTLQGTEKTVSDDQAECAATTLVDVVGLDAMREAGTPEAFRVGAAGLGSGLAGDQAEAVYDGLVECGIDLGEELRQEYTTRKEFDARTRRCLSGVLTPEAAREYLVTVFEKGTEVADRGPVAAGVAGCLGEELDSDQGGAGTGSATPDAD